MFSISVSRFRYPRKLKNKKSFLVCSCAKIFVFPMLRADQILGCLALDLMVLKCRKHYFLIDFIHFFLLFIKCSCRCLFHQNLVVKNDKKGRRYNNLSSFRAKPLQGFHKQIHISRDYFFNFFYFRNDLLTLGMKKLNRNEYQIWIFII